MAISNINAIINKDIHKVWDIVFAVEKYSEWRSDLSKTEIINEKQFIEYTKNGYATTFSITAVEPYKRWEFDMENSNMTGHWIGIFTAKGNETQIDFTENVTPKKWIMKPFVKIYLKKQQEQFVLDLKKHWNDNFQFICPINLSMKEIQPAGTGWLFCYSLYSNTAFIIANARACLLGEVSFQSASISRMVLISFSSSSSCRR